MKGLIMFDSLIKFLIDLVLSILGDEAVECKNCFAVADLFQ